MDNKDLKNLLKIMRQNGVLHYKTNELELQLSPEFLISQDKGESSTDTKNYGDEADGPWAGFPTGNLTPEQLMFYSSGGQPENDPYKDEQ